MFDLFGMIREKGYKMISKELLSEVLKFTKYNFVKEGFIEIEYSTIKYGVKHNIHEKINIYELAYKSKEWALSKGYMMKIENHYSNSIQIQLRKTIANSTYKEPWKKTFKNETEAIFKACEWILDNKED